MSVHAPSAPDALPSCTMVNQKTQIMNSLLFYTSLHQRHHSREWDARPWIEPQWLAPRRGEPEAVHRPKVQHCGGGLVVARVVDVESPVKSYKAKERLLKPTIRMSDCTNSTRETTRTYSFVVRNRRPEYHTAYSRDSSASLTKHSLQNNQVTSTYAQRKINS